MSTTTTARRGAAALVAGLAALALAAAPASARPATAAAAKPNLVETAVAAGNFTTLVSLVKQAGLAETLSGTGPYTVFAPTDAAFKKVPKKTLKALGKDKAKLKAVLLYHVASGRLAAKRVVKRSSIKTLNGKRVQIRVRGQNVFVNRVEGRHRRRARVQRHHPRHQPRPDPVAARRRCTLSDSPARPDLGPCRDGRACAPASTARNVVVPPPARAPTGHRARTPDRPPATIAGA